MQLRLFNAIAARGRRGHRVAVVYEDDRQTEAMYVVHRWQQQGFLDTDESGEMIERIAQDASVANGS